MTAAIQQLLDIMAQLRNPQGGCPWDLEQTYQTMIPCVLEESYEVAEALKTEDFSALQEELGDLLLQVVFLSQLAKEDQYFNFNTVVETLSNKLIHRHPHVFGDKSANSAAEALTNWESKKQQERLNKQQTSLLDDVPHALPALLRAEKLQKRAKKLNFATQSVQQNLEQAEQQLAAIKSAVAANQEHAAKPLAELLFSVSNLCRQLGLQAESLLRDENSRFEQRAREFESYSSNKHFK
ncbi:nucleoside triphosphate pyrophosphohydrolase [Testudinibacter sp. TR-2022]|uniref:nucleoside triphosphate pyrophosphohydrolase n=1 Tax=Testudinibacter sp. TR-2022 TaxID=2585029 RepID=UPI001118B14F|nr:nucleoside triphosphate pyrophosphohydrolase [Testudinibacter sp. TR-2022]TNH05612.1 nucleoside triphosphate pyrophosphohydrolase [Pasteurellaceae bacterium Phil11]TNH24338.1 nucleoside triphosphate pyrophosphohydrolase [Testudinibacter sp. TR-2022]TNH25006.1 nucleoside triphosphate pyrophosphohydrolase [Testudinibacter sp. TR-2022]